MGAARGSCSDTRVRLRCGWPLGSALAAVCPPPSMSPSDSSDSPWSKGRVGVGVGVGVRVRVRVRVGVGVRVELASYTMQVAISRLK